MDAAEKSDAQVPHRTAVARTSDRELTVTRRFDAPAPVVFEAWAKIELFRQWWLPKAFGAHFVSAEANIRTGGTYRFVIGHPSAPEPMSFFGRYLEVTPPARIVWTNEESEKGAVTTVNFTDEGGGTLVVVHELYPSKDALDEAMESGSTSGWATQFEQLDHQLAAAAG